MGKTAAPPRTIRPERIGSLCLMAGLIVLFLVQTLQRASRVEGYDFTSYLLSAQGLLHGGNPYDTASPFVYVYPLFLAFILIPLTVIPYGLACVIWFSLSATCLFAGSMLLVQMAEDEVKASVDLDLAVPGLAICAILFAPIHSNLLNGQVNLIVFFCCVMFFRCFRRNGAVWAAAWLAAAIAIKLLPAVLLLFLLVRSATALCSGQASSRPCSVCSPASLPEESPDALRILRAFVSAAGVRQSGLLHQGACAGGNFPGRGVFQPSGRDQMHDSGRQVEPVAGSRQHARRAGGNARRGPDRPPIALLAARRVVLLRFCSVVFSFRPWPKPTTWSLPCRPSGWWASEHSSTALGRRVR